MRRAIQRREVILKKQTLTIGCICAFTALRMFFTFFFFVTSVICIVKLGSRISLQKFPQGSAKTAKCLVVGHLVDFAYCHERSH